jgi:hypothetical protein
VRGYQKDPDIFPKEIYYKLNKSKKLLMQKRNKTARLDKTKVLVYLQKKPKFSWYTLSSKDRKQYLNYQTHTEMISKLTSSTNAINYASSVNKKRSISPALKTERIGSPNVRSTNDLYQIMRGKGEHKLYKGFTKFSI